MNNTNYILDKGAAFPFRDLIVNVDACILIEVFTHEDDFTIDESELCYYGDDHGDPLVFQTVGYADQNKWEIELAIMWYASTPLDYPQMELLKTPI